MRAEVPPQQRQVVVVAVGADLCTALAQRLQVAGRGEEFANVGADLGVIASFRHDVDHAVEHGDELFHLGALAQLDALHLLLCPLVDCAHAADEHFRQIIAATHAHVVEQRHDEGVALLRWGLLEVGRIQGHGLRGQRAQLGGRHARHYVIKIAQAIEPGYVFDEQVQMLARWPAGMALDVVVGGLPVVELARDEFIQALLVFVREPACDTSKERGLRARVDLSGDGVQGGERRQLDLLQEQRIDGGVDDVHRLVHRLGRLAGSPDGDLVGVGADVGLNA